MDSPTPMRRADDPRHVRGPRRGMALLPGLFTAANIAMGYYAIIQALSASGAEPWHFDNAAKAIGIAVVLDGLDGRIARLTGTTSDFGRELDSLADVITFGVAPALLAWLWGFRLLPAMDVPEFHARLIQVGGIASFVFLMAGASRLARFNIQRNPQPSNPGRPGRKYFVGMPIPAGAGVIAAIVHFTGGEPVAMWWLAATWVGLLVALAFLMVSTWRFYSFKDIDLRRSHPFRNIILIGFLFAAIYFFSRYVLFAIALVYMLSGVVARLFYALRRPAPAPAYEEASQPR